MKRSRKSGSKGSARLVPRHMRERRRIELLGASAFAACTALIVLVFLTAGLRRFLLGSPQVAAVVSAVLVDLANGDRASQGSGTLAVNPRLVAAAQAKANDMASRGYFAHVSPDGADPWHWFSQAGYTFDYAGENLAVDFADSGDVERAWMNSPTHRDNILNPHFTEIGIATARGSYQGRPTTFVVQEFGTPSHSVQKQVNANVPESPTQLAHATTQKPAVATARVLGTETERQRVAAAPLQTNPAPQTSPVLAAQLASKTDGNVPLWAYPISFPRDTLRYVYYAIGILVLTALALETGLEIRWHHRHKAARAGILLAAMCILVIVANYLFFTEPVLATTGSQKASVAAALR